MRYAIQRLSSKIINSKQACFFKKSAGKGRQASLTIYSITNPSKRRCKKMLASIPKGLYTRKQKIAIIKENAKRFIKASKKEKTLNT